MVVSLVSTGFRAGHLWLKAFNDLFDASQRLIQSGIAPALVLVDIFEIDSDSGLHIGLSLGFFPVAQDERMAYGFGANLPASCVILFAKLHEVAPQSWFSGDYCKEVGSEQAQNNVTKSKAASGGRVMFRQGQNIYILTVVSQQRHSSRK